MAPLERRVRNRAIVALVLLEALVSHSEIEPVLRSARDAGVALVYGGKAGLASIEAALLALNARFGRAAA